MAIELKTDEIVSQIEKDILDKTISTFGYKIKNMFNVTVRCLSTTLYSGHAKYTIEIIINGISSQFADKLQKNKEEPDLKYYYIQVIKTICTYIDWESNLKIDYHTGIKITDYIMDPNIITITFTVEKPN